MGAMASQITSRTIVYSVYRGADKNKTSKLRVTGICAGNAPVIGEFPTQRASYAENGFHLITSSSLESSLNNEFFSSSKLYSPSYV